MYKCCFRFIYCGKYCKFSISPFSSVHFNNQTPKCWHMAAQLETTFSSLQSNVAAWLSSGQLSVSRSGVCHFWVMPQKEWHALLCLSLFPPAAYRHECRNWSSHLGTDLEAVYCWLEPWEAHAQTTKEKASYVKEKLTSTLFKTHFFYSISDQSLIQRICICICLHTQTYQVIL